AVNRLLHRCIRILDTEGRTIQPQRAQRIDMRRRNSTGVDLNADLRVRREVEMLAEQLSQTKQRFGWEERRRAATEVKLRHLAGAVDTRRHERHLAGKILQVGIGPVASP